MFSPGCAMKREPFGEEPTSFLANLPAGSSLEYLGYSQEYLNHVTVAPPRGGRPGGAGWLARRVQTGRRVKLPGPMVRGWYEPCTFEQWMLIFEEHSFHTSGTMRRRPRDGRSGLPSTTLDHVSVKELSPTSPLRSWVSVVCWHHPLSKQHHRLAPFHWSRRTCPHEWLYRIIMKFSRRVRAVWPWESTRSGQNYQPQPQG